MKRRIPDRRAAAGFTLVELMIVVAIIGMVLVLGGLAARSNRDARRLKQAGTEIVTVVNTARSVALQERRAVEITIAASGLVTTRLAGPSCNDAVLLPDPNPLPGLDLTRRNYQQIGMTMEWAPAGVATVCILPNGRARDGAGGFITSPGAGAGTLAGTSYLQLSNSTGSLRRAYGITPSGRIERMPAGFSVANLAGAGGGTVPDSEGTLP